MSNPVRHHTVNTRKLIICCLQNSFMCCSVNFICHIYVCACVLCLCAPARIC